MRSSSAFDRRFIHQSIALGCLVLLPVTMVALNGVTALRSVLGGAENETSVAYGDEATETAHSKAPKPPPLYGVYDPAAVFDEDASFSIRHVYISWVAFNPQSLAAQLRKWNSQGVAPLITIEPWPVEGRKEQLLRDVAQGRYDDQLGNVIAAIDGLKGPIYLSWGHEMDQDLTERYPWSGAKPEEYVAAYRHVVQRVRSHIDADVRWVWAGVLKEGSLRYWPGDAYADYVGMPVYSYPEWDRRAYGYIRDFRTTFEEKRDWVDALRKPLFITELGVSGSDDFQSFWMRQAFLAVDDYDDIAAVVFFQAADAEGAWGTDVGTPDWRVHPDLIRGLVDWRLESYPPAE